MIKRIRHLRYQDKYTVSGTLNEIEKMSRNNADGKWFNGNHVNNQKIPETGYPGKENEEMNTPVRPNKGEIIWPFRQLKQIL